KHRLPSIDRPDSVRQRVDPSASGQRGQRRRAVCQLTMEELGGGTDRLAARGISPACRLSSRALPQRGRQHACHHQAEERERSQRAFRCSLIRKRIDYHKLYRDETCAASGRTGSSSSYSQRLSAGPRQKFTSGGAYPKQLTNSPIRHIGTLAHWQTSAAV